MFMNTDRLTLFTGMRFAIMQMKTGLCHILSRFEVAPCKETPVPIGLDTKSVLVMTDGVVPLSFKRI
jgi:cytochrome P450 family 6